jgi:hypothetical protein
MQSIPQIVRERLKAEATASGHPDADFLTAFAEQSLSKRERAGILKHLAACANCREIIALALPASGELGNASVAIRRPWFVWPALRWGFATAGLALLAVGIVEFERHQPANPTAVARQIMPAPVVAGLENQASRPTASTLPAPREAVSDESLGKSMVSAKKDARRVAEGEVRLHGKLLSAQPQNARAVQPPPEALVAKQAPAPLPAASQMAAVQAQNQAVQAQNQAVAVVEAQSTDSQVAQVKVPSSADQLFGYNSAPMSRAKPANIEPAGSGAAGAVLTTPRWSITAVGGLEQSLDQGKTWRDVDVNAPPMSATPTTAKALTSTTAIHHEALKAATAAVFFRAVTAAGSEVWAGGSNTALFHSADGGDHWTRILPSSSGVVLSGDVVSIEFPDPQHGTVTTSTPEIWITVDDGRSWQKR